MDFNKIREELKVSKVETNKYVGLTETSVDNYIKKLMFLQKQSGGILEYLKGIDNVNTKNSYFIAVVGAAKHSKTFKDFLGDQLEPIKEEHLKLITELKGTSGSQTKTDREKENWIEWTVIKKKATQVLAKNEYSQDDMLLLMYSLIPPSRLDFHSLLITRGMFVPEEASQNYIRITGASTIRLVLKEYKTSKTYDTLEIKLPKRLAVSINSFLKSEPNREYLFQIPGSVKPYANADTFGKYLRNYFKKEFGKNASVDILRHSYLTWFRKGDKSLARKEAVAKNMGHSVELQEQYRKVK